MKALRLSALFKVITPCFLLAALSLLFVYFSLESPARSEEVDCLSCHEDLKKEKVVHQALDMGCATCHTAIDAKDVPHKKTNTIAKGLSAEQPDLCYGCHDKATFSKKVVHAAVGMGCTGCHNPHSSKYAKLLKAEQPDVCFGCHDKAEFSKKIVHMPVASSGCTGCHAPHSSDNMAFLNKDPLSLCLECHADVKKKPHALAGFGGSGHPLGGPKRGDKEPPNDPARPDKKFYCGSCHNPHSSDDGRLFRYKGSSSIELCTHCHKM